MTRCVPAAQVVHCESPLFVQLRPVVQPVTALQLEQTRSCALVQELASYVPAWQVAEHATHLLPLRYVPAPQAPQTWSALVVHVTEVHAPIVVQAVQTRLVTEVHALLS